MFVALAVLVACLSPCPSEFVWVRGGTFTVGEDDPLQVLRHPGTVLPLTTLTVDDFCVARYPVPGGRGDRWPARGLHLRDVPAVDASLRAQGARLCDVSELLVAAAGPQNRRYPWGEDWQEGRCETSLDEPQPLGTWRGCRGRLGLRDLQVRSTWARVDPHWAHLLDVLQPSEEVRQAGPWLVWGGSAHRDSFYAPNNYGVHAHGLDEATPYSDDQLRLCAEPNGPAGEGLNGLLERVRETGDPASLAGDRP